MENILSHLLRSGEPQGAGLDVAADRQSGGIFPRLLNNIGEIVLTPQGFVPAAVVFRREPCLL